MRVGTTKVTTGILWCKKANKNFNVNVDNIVISKLVRTWINSKDLKRYLDEVIRLLVLIAPKISEYFKKLKYKGGDKNTRIN